MTFPAEIAGRNLKKVVLELGGSDPFILLSTDDMDATRARGRGPTQGPSKARSGGGGNRTRVRGRTGKSLYKLVLRLDFARRPVRRRPTDGLAILWSPAPGDWLSLGGKPVVGAGFRPTGRRRSDVAT